VLEEKQIIKNVNKKSFAISRELWKHGKEISVATMD
jgi:hypothetical protein